MWVSGLPGKKGKITFLGEGRALAYADDPAWSSVLAELWRRDAPAPPEVLDGVVEVLKRWSRVWQRPTAVVPMPSRRYDGLVRSVAEHIARVGRLPLVEALEVSGPPPAEEAASSVRAKDLLARTSLVPGVSLEGSGVAGGRQDPHPLDGHGRRIPAGRRGRGPGPAVGAAPAAVRQRGDTPRRISRCREGAPVTALREARTRDQRGQRGKFSGDSGRESPVLVDVADFEAQRGTVRARRRTGSGRAAALDLVRERPAARTSEQCSRRADRQRRRPGRWRRANLGRYSASCREYPVDVHGPRAHGERLAHDPASRAAHRLDLGRSEGCP